MRVILEEREFEPWLAGAARMEILKPPANTEEKSLRP
jgi:hypothetical protein